MIICEVRKTIVQIKKTILLRQKRKRKKQDEENELTLAQKEK